MTSFGETRALNSGMPPSFFPVSNPKDLSKIIVRKQNRNVNGSGWRPVVGVDTETIDGNIFLIANSFGDTLEDDEISFVSIAQFLLRLEGKFVFFYNLGYDAECILKLLPLQVLKSYKWKKRMEFEYAGFKLKYIEKKQLKITKGGHSISCYDVAQYFDRQKLQVAYNENIGKPLPHEYLEMKDKRGSFSKRYVTRHRKEIRRYCIQDCMCTKELAEHWIRLFYWTFGFIPANWVSPGYLAEKVLIKEKIPIPLFNDIPYEVQELAWKAFYGGRFELIQRGYIGECYLYDLNSAYPHALSTLPDLLNGLWVHKRNIVKIAALGFFRIRAHIDDSVKVAPFPFRTRKNMIIYPVGDFETFVTLEELRAVAGEPRIKYEILDSCQFIPNKDCTHTFKQFIEKQYYKRLELKEKRNPLERAIKVVLNSMYGKMAQRVNNMMGNLLSPVIASYITGFTRAQLYRFVRKHNLEKDVVAFATDSIATKRRIEGLDSKKLGEMKLDNEPNDAIFLSNGFYRMKGKWKQRGVGYDREKKAEMEHLDSLIGEDGQFYIKLKTTRTTHIKSGILYNKLKSVGKIEQYEKKIDLNSDKKRFWLPSELKSLHDGSSCDSSPLNINLLADIIAKKPEVTWEDELEEKYEPESEL